MEVGPAEGAEIRQRKLQPAPVASITVSSLVASLDAFWRPNEDLLSQGTRFGALLTLFAVLLCSLLFTVELGAFINNETSTHLAIDSDQNMLLRINFDVTLYDMACDFAAVGITDAFGTRRSNLTTSIKKQRIGHQGTLLGHPYTEEELTELEFADQQFTADELAELDADWTSMGGHSDEQDFARTLEAHDFVFVMFCAPEFPTCAILAPVWAMFTSAVNNVSLPSDLSEHLRKTHMGRSEEFHDANGDIASVWTLQVNCRIYTNLCKDNDVSAMPTIRLYPRSVQSNRLHTDINFRFPPQVMMAGIFGFKVMVPEEMLNEMFEAFVSTARRTVGKRHLHTNATHHDQFGEGCRISGHVQVPRVPGTLHLEGRTAGNKVLTAAFTNVSHEVHHFSFGDADAARQWLPHDYRQSSTLLDGRSFVAEHFHQAPHHYIKVVRTVLEDIGGDPIYLQTHQWNLRAFPRHESPKATFSYDLAPVEVVVSWGSRWRWYDLLTSVFANVGGAFASLSMVSEIGNAVLR